MGFGRRLALALLALLALSPAAAGRESPPVPQPLGGPTKPVDYKLTVAPGLAGKARLGWMPVYVCVDAGKEFEGDLVVQFRSQGGGPRILYEARKGLKLAARSKTEHHLCLRHDSPSAMQGVIEARLEDVRDTLHSQSVALVPQNEYLVCVVADRPLSLGFLSVRRAASVTMSGQPAKVRQFTVAQPTLAELPDKVVGYNGVDFLLIYGVSFENLRTEQLTAINDYLWRGGCVVLAARDRSWFARKEVQDLLPIRDGGAATGAEGDLLLRMLAGNSNYGAFSGETAGSTVHKFSIPGARDERSFYEAHRGLGTVLVWRLDPGQNVIGTWPGMPALWTDVAGAVLPLRTDDEGRSYFRSDSPSLKHAREVAVKLNLARERSVPGLLIVFLVVLYLVLVGPINYFALRKLDMRALSIVTLPLLAAVFVLLNFVVGYVSRGVVSSGRRVTVAVAPSGATRADCVTWLGLFPASSSLAELDTDSRGLILPLSDTSLTEHSGYQTETYTSERVMRRLEQRFMLERYALAMWKMFHFQAESTRSLGGGAMRLLDRGGKKLTVTNGTPLTLKDCFVASGAGGGDFCWLGDLPAGTSVDAALVPWVQTPRDFSQQGRQVKTLSLSGAVQLWTAGRLGSGQSYMLDTKPEGFAYQASQVISDRLGTLSYRGPLMIGRVDGEELDALRLNGRTPRGEGINVLVVTGEHAGGPGR